MSTSLSPKRHDLQAPRALPILAYFEEDAVARQFPIGTHRFRRMSFENTLQENPAIERVVTVSSEEIVQKHYSELRVPNVRVLALSKNRFKDARLDGAIYAYLPPDVPPELLERTLDNALDHIHLVQTRHEVNERLAGVTGEIHELNKIGVALSAEHDTRKLMETILTKSREFTRSDAGSIYLVERTPLTHEHPRLKFHNEPPKAQSERFEERIRFSLSQNDTVSVPFRESTMEINKSSIAGYVALSGQVVNIEDAYHLPAGLPYVINRKFDTDSGYRTKSILAVPMRNQKDKIVGVLQLINAKRDFKAKLSSLSAVVQQVVPYTARQQEIVVSLASQAAVALENSRLYESIQNLFEGFVQASVTAIEARDPATSGHSFRVAKLTMAMTEVVDRSSTGPYADVHFSPDQMREIRYASLLHDFGKVNVPEHVLIKAKKLYPDKLELIRQRFDFVKRTLENGILQSKIDYLLEKGREEFLQSVTNFDSKLATAVGELDDYLQAIIRSNEPTVLPEGNFERLLSIAAVNYLDLQGRQKPLLTDDEVRVLSIPRGSLDDHEREIIESHVDYTFKFLAEIPWTSEIRNIPAIARGHHEKLNGAGYPYKLSAPEIPVQTRMMTISDIFDALAASDRPYKKAVSVDRALDILELSVKEGELDRDLFDLFKTAKVYRHWKDERYPS
jgi:HD-GYP domain-containing protein (c-di-GMP phosphodiesterase class II)